MWVTALAACRKPVMTLHPPFKVLDVRTSAAGSSRSFHKHRTQTVRVLFSHSMLVL
jgi:hypothetical protein